MVGFCYVSGIILATFSYGKTEEIRQKYLQSIDYLMLWTSESTAVIINAKDASQTKLIPVNRVATGNLSLNYFVNK